MGDAEARSDAGAERTAEAAGSRVDWDPETTTVHEAIHGEPGVNEVFQRFGLDCCCGGERPVAEAAERHGVDLERLLEALGAARAEG